MGVRDTPRRFLGHPFGFSGLLGVLVGFAEDPGGLPLDCLGFVGGLVVEFGVPCRACVVDGLGFGVRHDSTFHGVDQVPCDVGNALFHRLSPVKGGDTLFYHQDILRLTVGFGAKFAGARILKAGWFGGRTSCRGSGRGGRGRETPDSKQREKSHV